MTETKEKQISGELAEAALNYIAMRDSADPQQVTVDIEGLLTLSMVIVATETKDGIGEKVSAGMGKVAEVILNENAGDDAA